VSAGWALWKSGGAGKKTGEEFVLVCIWKEGEIAGEDGGFSFCAKVQFGILTIILFAS